MGRPKIQIDEKQVKSLAERHWTAKEIAGHFGVCQDTINDRFSDLIKSARQSGKGKIRDVLWSVGLSGTDTKALLHLAKHYLGHHDKIRTEQKVTQTSLVINDVEEPGQLPKGTVEIQSEVREEATDEEISEIE